VTSDEYTALLPNHGIVLAHAGTHSKREECLYGLQLLTDVMGPRMRGTNLSQSLKQPLIPVHSCIKNNCYDGLAR
jgi:hypothetical protein